MDFSTFAQLLFDVIGNEARPQFVLKLFKAIMKNNDKENFYNPLSTYGDSFLTKLFSGKNKTINKQKIQTVYRAIDKQSFAEHFNEYSDEQLNELCARLRKYDYDVSIETSKDNFIGIVCADIFTEIISNMSDLSFKKTRRNHKTEKENSQVSSNDYNDDENDLYPMCQSCIFWKKDDESFPELSAFFPYKYYEEGFCNFLKEEKINRTIACNSFISKT